MNFVRSGTATPPLLFVHGFTSDHTDWAPQTTYFAKRHAVAACDLRGHGATPGTPADATPENFAADVAALLAELDWTGAILVGHSMGCRVVMQAALNAPERVAGIVLLDGSALGEGDPASAERNFRAAIQAVGFRAFSTHMFEEMFTPTSDPVKRAAILARTARFPEALGTAIMPRTAAWDARNLDQALASITVPILAIQSTTMNAARERVSLNVGDTVPYLERLRRGRPDLRTEIIPGAGHFTGLDAPDAVNRAIERFVAQIRAR